MAEQNENTKRVVLRDAPGNNKLIAPEIQKDIAECYAEVMIDYYYYYILQMMTLPIVLFKLIFLFVQIIVKSIVAEIGVEFSVYWLMSPLMFQARNKWL